MELEVEVEFNRLTRAGTEKGVQNPKSIGETRR